MRLKPVLIAVAALAALALLIRQVTQAVHRTFGGRPGCRAARPRHPRLPERADADGDRQRQPGPLLQLFRQGPGRSTAVRPPTRKPTRAYGSNCRRASPCRQTAQSDTYGPCQNLLTLTARASDGRECAAAAGGTSASHSSSDPTYILAVHSRRLSRHRPLGGCDAGRPPRRQRDLAYPAPAADAARPRAAGHAADDIPPGQYRGDGPTPIGAPTRTAMAMAP